MDAPPSCRPSDQGCVAAAVGDSPNQDVNHGIFSSHICGSTSHVDVAKKLQSYDADFEALLGPYGEGFSPLNNGSDLFDILYNEPLTAAGAPSSPPPDCRLQARVYNSSSSLTLTFTPAPSAEVVQLHCLPAPPLQFPAADYVRGPPYSSSPVTSLQPSLQPSNPLPASVAALGTDSAAHYSNIPRLLQPFHYDWSPNFRYGEDSCSHEDPHNKINSPLYDVESKHSQHLAFDLPYDIPKLVSPSQPYGQHTSSFSIPMDLGFPQPPQASTCPSACVTHDITSPWQMATTIGDSNFEALQMSTMSAPIGPASSHTSFNRASMLHHQRSLSVPPSPTSSVSKNASKIKKFSRSSHFDKGAQVALKVKTKLLNLHDGYMWKKYGEKIIKGQKFSRSYFRCNENERYGCQVLKRTQRCPDAEDHVQFTYLRGRHNHPS